MTTSGFFVLRIDYTDDEKWELWTEKYDELLEHLMGRRTGRRMGARPVIKAVDGC